MLQAASLIGAEMKVLQYDSMLNCITADIMLSFNIVTVVNFFPL